MDALNFNSPILLLTLVITGIFLALITSNSKASPSATRKMYNEYVSLVDDINEVISPIGRIEEEIKEKIFASNEDEKEFKSIVRNYNYAHADLTYYVERMGNCVEKGNVRLFKKTAKEASEILEKTSGYINALCNILSRMKTIEEFAEQRKAFEDPDDHEYYAEEDFKEEKYEEDEETAFSHSFPLKTSTNIFFVGCNDAEAVEKRYKSLAKVYHPDMPTGDEETFKRMKEEYETIQKRLKT